MGAAALISVIAFYSKVNYGIILVILFYAILFIALYKKLLKTKQAFILFLVQTGAIFILAFVFHVAIIPYIISCTHLINAYNDAMFIFISMSDFHFIMGVLVILLYVTGFAISFKYYFNSQVALLCYCLGALFLYLLFKNDFVRADNRYDLLEISPTIFGLTWVYSKDSIKRSWVFLTCSVVVISLITITTSKNAFSNAYQDYINGRPATFDYFNDVFTNVSYKNTLPDHINYWGRIPQKYLDKIDNNSVDIIPWEISEMYYNNLNYDPRPIIQSYNAFDEYLDEKNYEKYMSPTAPDFIVFALKSIDFRYPFWDESITKRAMLTNYELDTLSYAFLKGRIPPVFNEEEYLKLNPDIRDSVNQGYFKSGLVHYVTLGQKEGRKAAIDYNLYILLKKREKPMKLTIIKEMKVSFEIGKTYLLDTTTNLQYLYADVQYDLIGKIKRLLFQPPQLKVILTFNDGRSYEYQAIVPILGTGVLLNPKIENINDVAKFFSSKDKNKDKIQYIQFEADYGFKPEINGVIKELKIE